MSTTDLVLSADGSERPCRFHKYHWPPVLETELHHLKPVYLQNRVHGKIVDPTTAPACPTGHSNFHAWISYLLGERRRRPWRLGTRVEMKHAREVVDWYLAATA